MKKCKITNGLFMWVLEVDRRKIFFQDSQNVDYFSKLYEKLGYEVEIVDNYKKYND